RGAGGDVGGILPRRIAAASPECGPAFPYPDILLDLHHAKLPPHLRLAGARVRDPAGTADGGLALGSRSAVDRHRGRIAGLCHSPPAGDAQMSGLEAYLLLVLVGFLPSEIWRMLGFITAHGIADETELFLWVRSVAIAVLAGVIAKLI